MKEEDSEFLLGLRNTADIRRQCFKNKIINSDEHEKWFAEVMADLAWSLYIVVANKTPVGQARIHKTDSRLCEISFALFPTILGQRLWQGYSRSSGVLGERNGRWSHCCVSQDEERTMPSSFATLRVP